MRVRVLMASLRVEKKITTCVTAKPSHRPHACPSVVIKLKHAQLATEEHSYTMASLSEVRLSDKDRLSTMASTCAGSWRVLSAVPPRCTDSLRCASGTRTGCPCPSSLFVLSKACDSADVGSRRGHRSLVAAPLPLSFEAALCVASTYLCMQVCMCVCVCE